MVAIFRFTLPTRKEWSAAEQAEFVRAAAILRGTGLPIVCETGMSDEGDPWVIFLREDTGDVIAHIAKIDGQVMAASAATGDVVCGPSFRTVMDKVVRSQPLVLPSSSVGDRIHLHPAAVIVAFIATALAWSLDDDARVYDWKVDADGTVALTGGGRDSSGNVLRDSLFSKAEASRLGLDINNHNLSSSLVVAAALAAVAIAAKSMDLLLGDDSDRVTALPDSTDRTHAVALHDSNALPSDPQVAAADVAVTNGASGGDHLAAADLGQEGLLWRGMADSFASHNIKLLFDASRVGQLPELPVLAADKAGLADGLIQTVNLKSLPPISEAPADGAPNPVAVVAQRNEAVTTEKADTDASHAATTQQQPTALSPVSHVVSSSEPFKLVFSADLRWLTFHDDPITAKAPTVAADPVAAAEHVAETAAQPAATSTSSPTGTEYQLLVGNILSFANDPHHELAASASTVKPLQQALADFKPWLPDANLILIVDIPGVKNANVFKFESLTMVTQEAAERLMPSVEFHVQQEVSLGNGQTLKLLGVIDLHDYPAFA
jgi:hypothetical protein